MRKLRQRNYTGKIVVAKDGQEALAMAAKEKLQITACRIQAVSMSLPRRMDSLLKHHI
jgi:hypothetical protein